MIRATARKMAVAALYAATAIAGNVVILYAASYAMGAQ